MPIETSPLQKARACYQPKLPAALKSSVVIQPDPSEHAASIDPEVKALFPNTVDKPVVRIIAGQGSLPTTSVTVGVVLSGGPAPGGHNAVCGLFDALKAGSPESRLVGFMAGPKGIIDGKYVEFTSEIIDSYRNTGGFDIIGSGRDKIESDADIESCINNLKKIGATALVVIGGDDSNTNAAILAENFLARNTGIQVIGLPKTIDGDMKSDLIETSFGFDTASKIYANMVSNLARDGMSSRKYTHFVKLMGRAASHVALEVALQVQPNLTFISEEVEARELCLVDIVDQIVKMVVERSKAGRHYGVIVIPEGLVEFLKDFKILLVELGTMLREEENVLLGYDTDEDRRQFVSSKLTADSGKVYSSLPNSIQHVLLQRDKHGNIPVSQVATDELLMDLAKLRIQELQKLGKFDGVFEPLAHFFGYEGRCVAPSNFDADYCYALGFAAIQLIRADLTGYTVFASNMTRPAEEWVMGGVPVTSMLNMESRKGKMKPVIRKALVELEGAPFKEFAAQRDKWLAEDNYLFPGPIQYYGPSELCDRITRTLELEQN